MFGPSSDSSFRHGAPAQFGMGPERRWPACPPADRGRGVACPTCGGGVCSLVLRREKSPRTRRLAPRKLHGPHPNTVQRKKRFPSTYPGHFDRKCETVCGRFLEKFSHRTQATVNRNLHRTATYILGQSDLPNRPAQQVVCVDPLPLDRGQMVECAAQPPVLLH